MSHGSTCSISWNAQVLNNSENIWLTDVGSSSEPVPMCDAGSRTGKAFFPPPAKAGASHVNMGGSAPPSVASSEPVPFHQRRYNGDKCVHGNRWKCALCSGASICEHGGQRTQCEHCGGASICQHWNQRSECNDCTVKAVNVVNAMLTTMRTDHMGPIKEVNARLTALRGEHGGQAKLCQACEGGASFCEHGRQRSRCRECGAAGKCEHGRRSSECTQCGGNGICEHGRQQIKCRKCDHKTCRQCGGSIIGSPAKRRGKPLPASLRQHNPRPQTPHSVGLDENLARRIMHGLTDCHQRKNT
jgi:hypothetical protein